MKRDRTAIWRRALTYRGLLPLMAVALTLALSSCAKEPLGNSMAGGDGMEVRVAFLQSVTSKATTGGTEVGAIDENRLDRVTILIFNEDGTTLETVLSEDVTAANTSLATTQPKWATEQTLIVTPISNPSSPKQIYAIANWSKTSFDKDTYTEAELKEELTTIATVDDINGVKAYPMLMSGSKAVTSISSELYTATVDMARQSSKIRANLSITTATQNLMPQIEWQLDLMSITVANVPDKSYIVGRGASPTGVTLLNSTPTLVDDTKPAAADQAVPATKDLQWSESLYITENPVVGALQANKDTSTYIVVQLPYKNRISGTIEHDNYYKLHVNDTRDAASPHKVLRNTIYNFNISILGIGSPINNLAPDVNVDGQLTVNSWEKGEVVQGEVLNNYFNIDRTTFRFQLLAGSFQSTIATDVADWRLVNEDGTTIFSFAEGQIAPVTVDGITYTLGGTSSAATVTVSKLVTAAVFTTQKMFFEAKNLKVPFTVVADNGFIPNSVLTAAGWPDTNLPLDGGLQVAMRGNIMTGGAAAANDPTIVWSTESVATGLTAVGLGKGKENYALLATLDVAKYPISQACQHLGPEWYVPSKDELKLLYDNKSLLTASYAFTANVYWSVTEATSDNSWYVSFLNGDASSGSTKSGTNSVRCVRGGVYPAAISVTPTVQADIPAAGGKYTVQLTSNHGWSVSSTNSGVTFSPSEGAPGLNMPVEITIPVNATALAVSYPVVFTTTDGSTTATATWTGSQLAKAFISLNTTNQANLNASGGKYYVLVTSYYAWSVSSTIGGVTFSPSSGAAGTNMSVEISVPAHAALTGRQIPAVFTTTGGGTTYTATWTGTQLAFSWYITINGLKWTVGNLVADGANGAKVGHPTDGGLYFQFGSLLGWKGGASGDGTGDCTKYDGRFYVGSSFNAANEIAVKPTVFTTIGNIGTTWPNQSQNLYYFGLSSYATAYAKLRDFAGFTIGNLAASGVGDPCTYYLGYPWRQPTVEECKTMCNNYGGGNDPGSANAAWRTSPTKGMNFNNNSTQLFIPASGVRTSGGGAIYHAGTSGYYWSGSVSNAAHGYTLRFSSVSVNPQGADTRHSAFPVRCVQ